MKKVEPFVKMIPVSIPGTARFKIKAVLIDPETRQRVKNKKTKKERRRIRKRFSAEKKTRREKEPEAGRVLKYIGTGRLR